VSGSEPSALTVLGLTAAEERVYRRLLRAGSLDATTAGESEAQLRRLADAGLVELDGAVVRARPPAEALSRLVEERTRQLRSDSDRLDAVRRLVHQLSALHDTALAPEGDAVRVERVRGGDVAAHLRSLAFASSGDLLWLRPDQWRLEPGPRIDAAVKELLAAGRRSRAIYPARVLEEAPHVIRERAEAGEHVRILADVPLRFAVMGSAVAVVSEDVGVPGERRLVIREEVLVGALAALFDGLWEKAMAVPGLDGHRPIGDPSDERLLLGQLAAGAKDEQIARAMGVSVRTVRRRVADVLVELGADSRFQAGVEAVRRGWV